MTTLGLRDRTHTSGWFRVLLACAVAVLAAAVMVHHGWMGGMDHAAGSPAAPGTTHTSHDRASPSESGHPMHHHTAGADAAVTTHANDIGSAGDATIAGGAAPSDAHTMTMAMCLAVLAGGLLLPLVAFVRRLVRQRALRTRRMPRRTLRPPSVVLPSIWIPPPRGGPSTQSLLCVVRR